MNCRTSREYINLTLDGRLSPGKAEILEAHIETCSQCDAYRSALQQVDNLFTAEPARSAPPMLAANIMQELELRTEARRPRQRGLMLALATITFIAAMLVPVSAAIGFTFLIGNEPTLSSALLQLGLTIADIVFNFGSGLWTALGAVRAWAVDHPLLVPTLMITGAIAALWIYLIRNLGDAFVAQKKVLTL